MSGQRDTGGHKCLGDSLSVQAGGMHTYRNVMFRQCNSVQLSTTALTGARLDTEEAAAQPPPRVAAPNCRGVVTQRNSFLTQ